MSCRREPAPLSEPAPAKVNLSLRVLGRRPDGYHELESLVMFAGGRAVDRVTLVPGGPLHFDLCGRGVDALLHDGKPNLVVRAAEAALRACPRLMLGTFRLEKHLPTAAGLGGGSADAAAALRLIRRANPADANAIDWTALAASIGADVPVCLASQASLMAGLGERVTPLPGMLPVWAVLANPGMPLETRAVFKALDAPPLEVVQQAPLPDFAGLAELIAGLRDRPNDLEATAERLCPPVAVVREALARLDGALLARMSGSGPTCFALFASAEAAEAGARVLRSAEPRWWIEPAPLG
jgi:4-diphosphocytidyl-2-C-methyl-D-erythritol kinase